MNDIRIDRGLARYISLGVGLVSFVVMIIAIIVAPQQEFTTIAYVSLGVGIVGLAGFVLLDPDAVVEGITGRSGQYVLSTILFSVLFVGVMVALYVVIQQADFEPFDPTNEFATSQATKELLSGLDEEINAIAFIAAQDSSTRDNAELWLQEYARLSNNQITYEFIDPVQNPGIASTYDVQRSGVIVFEQGDQTATATGINERGLTTAIARVIVGEARQAYIVTGHGERDFFEQGQQSFAGVRADLENAGFEFTPINLGEEGAVPDDADLLIIADPNTQFAPGEVSIIDDYMSTGGKLLVFADPAVGNIQSAGSVLGVAISPDGGQFASAGTDGTVKLWQFGEREPIVTMRGHSGSVVDVAFHPDGDELASMSADGTVRVWDAESGDEIAVLEGHQTNNGEINYSPTGDLLASAGTDQVVLVWDTSSYEPTAFSPIALPAQLTALDFSPDGSLMAALGIRGTSGGSAEATVYLLDPETGEQVASGRVHGAEALGLAWSPDGSAVHTVAVDGTEGIFDVEEQSGVTESPYDSSLVDIVFAPDGRRIYSFTDGTIHIRDGDTADDVILDRHEDIIWRLAIGPDGDSLVSGGRDGNVRIWSLEDEEQTSFLEGPHAATDPLFTYLLDEWGIQVNDDVVLDFTTQGQVGDAATPVLNNMNSTHPITEPLVQAGTPPFFFTAHSIVPTGTEGVSLTTLLETASAPQAWAESSELTTQPQFDPAEDVPGPVPVAVSGQQATGEARIVVIGDADFASGQFQQQTTFGNTEFLINAANWLTEGENAVVIPPSEIDQATFDSPLGPAELTLIQIAVTCLIPGTLVVVGGILWIVRRRRR